MGRIGELAKLIMGAESVEGMLGIGEELTALDEENDNFIAGANAQVTELTGVNTDLADQVQKLQAENYTLLTALAGTNTDPAEAEEVGVEESEYEEGAEPVDDVSAKFKEDK